MNKFLIITVAVLSAIISCKSQYEVLLASNDVDAKYKAAMEFFANKKYQKSAQLFESMAVLTSGTSRDDTVQYYWGLSNYRAKDYFTAEPLHPGRPVLQAGLPLQGHIPLGTGPESHARLHERYKSIYERASGR